jgi:hypothetical protein
LRALRLGVDIAVVLSFADTVSARVIETAMPQTALREWMPRQAKMSWWRDDSDVGTRLATLSMSVGVDRGPPGRISVAHALPEPVSTKRPQCFGPACCFLLIVAPDDHLAWLSSMSAECAEHDTCNQSRPQSLHKTLRLRRNAVSFNGRCSRPKARQISDAMSLTSST